MFGVAVPERVEGVPDEILDPRSTWSDSRAYDARAAQLAEMFRENFEQFADEAGGEILAAGPVPALPS